jgi:hypothetical protein
MAVVGELHCAGLVWLMEWEGQAATPVDPAPQRSALFAGLSVTSPGRIGSRRPGAAVVGGLHCAGLSSMFGVDGRAAMPIDPAPQHRAARFALEAKALESVQARPFVALLGELPAEGVHSPLGPRQMDTQHQV